MASASSRHMCLIYEGHPSEQLPVVVPFLASASRRGWRCVYLGDPEMVAMVGAALTDHGLDTARAVKQGGLILSSKRSHLAGAGGFDPRTMLDGLRKMIADSVADGYAGLCATGDMMWELGSTSAFSKLVEYEALLEGAFTSPHLVGICQYRKDAVPPRALAEALYTHRSAYIGSRFVPHNAFFLPPEVLLEGKGPGTPEPRQAERMCEQILASVESD